MGGGDQPGLSYKKLRRPKAVVRNVALAAKKELARHTLKLENAVKPLALSIALSMCACELQAAVFATLDPPGATSSSAIAVVGNQVVGSFVQGGHEYGFLYSSGQYLTINVPGATSTSVNAISGNSVVGSFSDGAGGTKGFLFDGATYTTLSPPGSSHAFANAVSGSNVFGTYLVAGTHQHGFVFDGAAYTTIDFPGAFDTG